MQFATAETELTTAGTDLLLAVVCMLIAVRMPVRPGRSDGKRLVWVSLFWCLGTAALIGAVIHSIVLTPSVREFLWIPLNLLLCLAVALFLVASVHDLLGQSAARLCLPWAIGAATGVLGFAPLTRDPFAVFLVYVSVAMCAVLGVYSYLSHARRLAGATQVALGIGLTLVAAGLQTTRINVRLVVQLDHNGVFHLVQLGAVWILASGVRTNLKSE